MSYNLILAERILKVLESIKYIEQKKMFGGLCFLQRGNMIFGIVGDRLMIRVGPDQYEMALEFQHASVMDFTGKPMKGFIFVRPEGFKSDRALKKWLELGLNYSLTLPVKKKVAKRKVPFNKNILGFKRK